MTTTHPKALGWLSVCYSFFMASFVVIVASLVLYQKNALQLSNDHAYGVFAAAVALLWILPVGGGYLSNKLGYANAAKVGLLVCFAGMVCFCFYSATFLYIGLGLYVVGNAFATPAIWCMVDHCYSKTSELREAGFTLFYLIFNIGAVVGIFLGGYLAKNFGFAFEFGLSAFFLLVSFVFFLIGEKKVTPHKGRTILPQLKWAKREIYASLVIISILSTPVTIFLFYHLTLCNILMVLLLGWVTGFLVRIGIKQKEKILRNKIFAFIILSLISVAFWTLYSLEPSFLSVFIQNNVNTNIFGINIPPSSFFAFDGVFVILFGLILSHIWYKLSKRGKNPSLSLKFAGSLIVIGIGFCFVAIMITQMGLIKMPAIYIIVAYAIFAIGELLVSPLGISMVGSLAPEGREGVMMGFWQLCSGIGGLVAGAIAAAPKLPEHTVKLAKSYPVYLQVFFTVGIMAICIGFAVILFAKKLKSLLSEHTFKTPQI